MSNLKIKITTSKHPTEDQLFAVDKIKDELGLEYVERKNNSLSHMIKNCGCTHFLVVKRDKIVITDSSLDFFWHPSTALLRIKSMKNGIKDPIVEAMGLTGSESVLDCTLGIASDALVVADFLNEDAKIIGTESNKFIAFMTKEGLKSSVNSNSDELNLIKCAASKIDVINDDYINYLKASKDKSFDIVYLDPMFKVSNEKSFSMNAFRDFAEHSYITNDVLNEAKRVAKKRVVIKERMFSKSFEEWGITEFYGGGARGSIKYGVIMLD